MKLRRRLMKICAVGEQIRCTRRRRQILSVTLNKNSSLNVLNENERIKRLRRLKLSKVGENAIGK